MQIVSQEVNPSVEFGHAALLPDGVDMSIEQDFIARVEAAGMEVVARYLGRLLDEDLDTMYASSVGKPYHEPMKDALLRGRGPRGDEPPRIFSFIIAGECDVASRLKEIKGRASDPYGRSFRGDYSLRYLLSEADEELYARLIGGTLSSDDEVYPKAREVEQVVRREERLHTSDDESAARTIEALHPREQIEEADRRFPGLLAFVARAH